VRLTDEIHLVGSGSGGFDLTDPFDCHVYLVDGGDEAALIDAGIGTGTDAILANVQAAGVERERIRYVVVTHAHPDHSGGAAALRERLPDVEILASPQVAGWIRTADEGAMSLEVGKRSEFYPPDFRFAACAVAHELAEGDRIEVGGVTLDVIETAGHADGHLSFLASGERGRVLFGGDLVFFGGRISLEATWDCRIQEYEESMRKLAGGSVETLLPGHHFVTLARGQRHIDAANRLFERGFVPRSVV
jgi:hydroxyacylglutathione hydrolase